MRTLILIIILCRTMAAYTQSVDSLGMDNDPILNYSEVDFLNSLLQEMRDTFNFTGKKVAFITGSNGATIVSKSDYFRNSIKPWLDNYSRPQIFMVELTQDEKVKSCGYDVLVLSWVKIFTPRRKEMVINQLCVREPKERPRQPGSK